MSAKIAKLYHTSTSPQIWDAEKRLKEKKTPIILCKMFGAIL